MKKILLISFCFFLTGCFDGKDSTSKNHTEKFKIENSLFKFELTEEWETLTPNNKKGEVILAQKNDENFVITHQGNYSNKTPEMIIQAIKQNFFSFELLEQNKKTWSFQGKLSAKTPKRKFHQKIILLPDSKQFLLGSCSEEVFEDRKSDCINILDSFVISK